MMAQYAYLIRENCAFWLKSYILEDFESGNNSYWNGNVGKGIIFQDPLHSLYTIGLDAGSTLSIQQDVVHSGFFSGELSLKWIRLGSVYRFYDICLDRVLGERLMV